MANSRRIAWPNGGDRRRLSALPRSRADRLQVQLMLDLAEDLVGDRAFVAQADEDAALGVDHRRAEAAAGARAAAVVVGEAGAVAQLGAQPFDVAAVDPWLARQVLERFRTAAQCLT